MHAITPQKRTMPKKVPENGKKMTNFVSLTICGSPKPPIFAANIPPKIKINTNKINKIIN